MIWSMNCQGEGWRFPHLRCEMWGTRRMDGVRGETQIPFGDDKQKGEMWGTRR